MKSLCSIVILFALLATLTPSIASASMDDDVNQAITIFERFKAIPEHSIPPAVLRDAKGLAFISIMKAGFIVSARGGTGVVVARTKKGWSPPSAIGTGGAGFGFQIGAQVSEFIFVLNTYDAVKAFSRGGNIQLGADLSVAAGPIGRTAEAGIMPKAAIYTYSRSQGLFAGVSLEGTIIGTRDDTNASYYGRRVSPEEILYGKVKTPPSAKRLQATLKRY